MLLLFVPHAVCRLLFVVFSFSCFVLSSTRGCFQFTYELTLAIRECLTETDVSAREGETEQEQCKTRKRIQFFIKYVRSLKLVETYI